MSILRVKQLLWMEDTVWCNKNMDEQIPSTFRILLRLTRPWSFLAATVMYFMGGGIARYLGDAIHWTRFWIGLLTVLLLLLAAHILKMYYDLIDAGSPLRRMQKDLQDEEQLAAQRISRHQLLFGAFTVLTAVAVTTVLLLAESAIRFPGLVILGISFLLAFFYGVPPLRLVYHGYGELSEAILVVGLFPALAFLLQADDLHRLLPMACFPLLAFYIAMRLAQSLKNYAHDQKLNRRTMMLVIGWQRGMIAHNLLILAGYLLLLVAAVFGLPWRMTWPALLTLPVGLFQIFQMNQIGAGAKPAWRMLQLTSAATFGLTAYLLTLAVWTG